jgi:hypothetical protein
MYITSFLCSLHSYFWGTVLHVNLTLYAVYDSNGNIVLTYWKFEVISLWKPFCYIHANTSSQSRGRFDLYGRNLSTLRRIVLPPLSEQNGFSVTTARSSSLSLFTFLVISYRNFLVYYFTLRNNDHLLTENDTAFSTTLQTTAVHIPDCEWRRFVCHDVKRIRKGRNAPSTVD